MAQEVITDDTGRVMRTQSVDRGSSSSYGLSSLVYLVVGIIEILLAFRLAFFLLNANAANGFVNFIYTVSRPFVSPFYGIFGQVNTAGATFDPATLIAMVVYAVIGWALVSLIATLSRRPADTM